MLARHARAWHFLLVSCNWNVWLNSEALVRKHHTPQSCNSSAMLVHSSELAIVHTTHKCLCVEMPSACMYPVIYLRYTNCYAAAPRQRKCRKWSHVNYKELLYVWPNKSTWTGCSPPAHRTVVRQFARSGAQFSGFILISISIKARIEVREPRWASNSGYYDCELSAQPPSYLTFRDCITTELSCFM